MEFLQVQLNKNQYNSTQCHSNSMQYYNNSLELLGNRLEENRTKCGEIFATGSDSFNFLCTFCGTLLKDIDSFTQHMKIYHNNIFQSAANQFHTFLPESEIKIEEEFAENNDDSVDYMKSEAKEENFIDLEVSENFKQITEVLNKQNENVKNEMESKEISHFTKTVNNCDKFQNKEIKKSIFHTSNKPETVTVKSNFQKASDESIARTKNNNKPKSKRKRLRKNSVTYFCDICDKEFYKESVLKSHMMYDHHPTHPFLQKSSTQSDTNKEEMNEEKDITKIDVTESIEQDPLKCRYCDRKFKTRVLRFEHECLHTGEKPHICNYCPKTFRTKRTLNEHLRIHENKKEFKCEICGVGFNCKTNLTVHIRRHKNERRHKCSYCDKTFICMTTKKTHERTHTGEKPYQCSECGQSFLTSSHLGVHIRRHTGEKPHKCEYCEKTFVTKEYMKRHQVIHGDERPFKCDVCDATFQRRGGLRQHKKIHSDIIGYVCNICGKGFKQFSGLYCHKKSHGENVALTQKS